MQKTTLDGVELVEAGSTDKKAVSAHRDNVPVAGTTIRIFDPVNYKERKDIPGGSRHSARNSLWGQSAAVALVLAMLLGFIAVNLLTGGKLAGWLNDGATQIYNRCFSQSAEVPENLSAQGLYHLALEYKDKGWVEPAKLACLKAQAKDPQGQAGKNATIFKNVALPKSNISSGDVQRNITAYNLMASGDGAGAVKAFSQLIADCPEFEWPYGNLASMYLEENNLAKAKPLIDRALLINPNYLNGLRYKSDLCDREKDYDGSLAALKRACNLLEDSSDPIFLSPLKQEIEQQINQLELRINRSPSTIQ